MSGLEEVEHNEEMIVASIIEQKNIVKEEFRQKEKVKISEKLGRREQ